MANGTGSDPTPRLAVVITCFNYEDYVGHAIGSVLSQGREDVELIVVDDGSTDRSWLKITASGVEKAFCVPNGGQRLACLHGLDRTAAPFMMFLDADDELKPGSLETILRHLDRSVAKLQFPLLPIDAEGGVIGEAFPRLEAFRGRDELMRQVLRGGVYATPPTSGNVFRRDVCELLRDADYDRAVDGVILFAAPFYGDVVSLAEPLALYRIHGRNDSGVGSAVAASSLKRDIDRFTARARHLREVLAAMNPPHDLTEPAHAFFVLERSFYLDIASGSRPKLRLAWMLLYRLWGECYSLRDKAVMTVFFTFAAILPDKSARSLLAYRLKSGRRSMSGFLKAMVSA